MNRWSAKSFLLLALALTFQTLAVGQEPTAGRRVKTPPTAEQLKSLVEQLSADEFLVRETAMLELVRAGQPAIGPISAAFTGGSLETTTRGLYVLQQLGLSSDAATQEAARVALVAAASKHEDPAVARRATGVLAQLLVLRSEQALAELQALGAKIVRSQSFNGVTVEEIVESIQIGPDFRGGTADLSRLKWLTAIKLILVGDKVTDEWLQHSANMTGLEQLHLYQAAVTEEGWRAIAEHPGIEQLGIYYTPLTARGLAHLEKLPRLSFVKLYGTKIERADVEKFQQTTALPPDKVDCRKGAFLGVGCSRGETSCILSTVHVGSPAEKAGLLVDDVLLRFDQSNVDAFETLNGLISQLNSGDVAEIEVQREVEDDQGNIRTRKVVVKATLAPWDVELAVENGERP